MALKDKVKKHRKKTSMLRMAAFPPFRLMLANPIGQGLLKSDVIPGLLRLDPFVLQDLVAFRLELAIQ
jgi:hypothetical protein